VKEVMLLLRLEEFIARRQTSKTNFFFQRYTCADGKWYVDRNSGCEAMSSIFRVGDVA
jgi:hypothetical protein